MVWIIMYLTVGVAVSGSYQWIWNIKRLGKVTVEDVIMFFIGIILWPLVMVFLADEIKIWERE